MSAPNKTKTVLVLVGIMLLSGILIPAAYLRYMSQQDFRPPFERRLHKNIQLMAEGEEIISLSRFEGKLWLAYATSTQPEEQNLRVHKQVEALRAEFPNNEILTCIFVVDLAPDQGEALRQYRQEHQAWLTPQDTLVAARVPVIQKYLKNEFRFGLLPYQRDEIWHYDRDLIVVDTKKHLRGHFDFAKAEQTQQADLSSQAVDRLSEQLSRTILYLIDNPEEESPFIRK